MGLFDIFYRLDLKTNNGLNLIRDKENKNLLYAFNKKNGKIDGLLQIFHSVRSSGQNPNYKKTNVGLVYQEYFFIDGLPNGYFKEFDSKGNLSCYIENIKANSFNFKSKFSINFLNTELLFSDKYQINGFVNEYNTNGILSTGTLSAVKKVKDNKLISSESYYENGQLHKDYIKLKEYYENGQLKKDSNGIVKEYYENGQLKFDLIRGKEYFENGAIKIDNDYGAKYLILENLNTVFLNENYSFEKFLSKDTILKNKRIYDYFKNVLIYDNEGKLINIEQIIDLYDQEDYDKSISARRKILGGHVSITHLPYFETKYSEPLLINNFCFIVSVKYYAIPIFSISVHTRTHISAYTGWHNNIYYNDGINSDGLSIESLEKNSNSVLNKSQNAIEFYQRGIEKDANSDYEGAIIEFTKAIEIDNQYIEAYRARSSARIWINDYEGIVNDYTKIIELNSEDSDAYESRGRAKAGLKDYIGAIEDFNKAIELDKESKVYSSRGRMKKNLLDYNGALLDYNIAVEKYPEDESSYFGRGELKYVMADYHGAIIDFNKCIEIKPNRIMSFHKRGDCKLKTEDFKGAIEDYSLVIQNRQDKYDVNRPPSENATKLLTSLYYNRGFARFNIKEYNKAIEDLKIAIKLDPDFEEAKQLLETIGNN
jgi:tetratricopeptide (TPR) repeat protein